MEKVKRDFEDALKSFNKDNGWTVTDDTFTIALRAFYYVQKLMDKQDEIVDEIDTCYSILLKVQDWIVKHEKQVKLTMREVLHLMIEDMKNANEVKTTNSIKKIT